MGVTTKGDGEPTIDVMTSDGFSKAVTKVDRDRKDDTGSGQYEGIYGDVCSGIASISQIKRGKLIEFVFGLTRSDEVVGKVIIPSRKSGSDVNIAP